MYRLREVRVVYDGRTVLDIDSLDVAGDEITAILGHNGSGKSTLLKVLAQEVRPNEGTVELDNRPLASYARGAFARRVAYLPQRLPEVAGLDVRELCGLGRFPWRGMLGRWRPEDTEAVETAIRLTDTQAFADQLVDTLSGGERQRAWIAMLLAQGSPMLLLDEPVSALDVAHQAEILRLLRSLNIELGRGVVAILHDINLTARHADRVVALKAGRVAFDGPPADFMSREVLRDIYGIELDLVAHPRHRTPVAVVA